VEKCGSASRPGCVDARHGVPPQALYRRGGFGEDPGSLTPISAANCMPPLFIHERTAYPARVAGLVVNFYHSLPLPRLPQPFLPFWGWRREVFVWNEPLLNIGLLGRKGQDFNALAFVQILQANLHAILELYSVSIGVSVRRKLAKRHRFGCGETVGPLQGRRNLLQYESCPIRNTDRTDLWLRRKSPELGQHRQQALFR